MEQPQTENQQQVEDKDGDKTSTELKSSPDAPQGGLGGYVVSPLNEDGHRKLRLMQRVFTYADPTSWVLSTVAFFAAIAAGALLPLMDLLFGKFVTTCKIHSLMTKCI